MPRPPPTHVEHSQPSNAFTIINVLLLQAFCPIILLCIPFVWRFHPDLRDRLLRVLQVVVGFLQAVARFPRVVGRFRKHRKPHTIPPRPTPHSGTIKENVPDHAAEIVMLSATATNEAQPQAGVIARELEYLKAAGSVAKLVSAYPATMSSIAPSLPSPPTPALPTSSKPRLPFDAAASLPVQFGRPAKSKLEGCVSATSVTAHSSTSLPLPPVLAVIPGSPSTNDELRKQNEQLERQLTDKVARLEGKELEVLILNSVLQEKTELETMLLARVETLEAQWAAKETECFLLISRAEALYQAGFDVMGRKVDQLKAQRDQLMNSLL